MNRMYYCYFCYCTLFLCCVLLSGEKTSVAAFLVVVSPSQVTGAATKGSHRSRVRTECCYALPPRFYQEHQQQQRRQKQLHQPSLHCSGGGATAKLVRQQWGFAAPTSGRLLNTHHRHQLGTTRRSTMQLLATSDSNSNNDDEGAKLAAELFKLAQRKGISLNDDDFDDEDEDDDDDDNEESSTLPPKSTSRSRGGDVVDDDDDDEDEDDEPEPNIPQGAINAFLGYDTGNVGERLAGNVTLTNDQLYSEVKERVLDTVGGFLSYVKKADEDDDDDDDYETTKAIDDAPKPYEAPTTVPDSDLTAGEVIIQVLESLRNNDTPSPNKGVEILFGYSSPGSQIKQEIGLTPVEYAEFLKETEYKILFTHTGPINIDKADYSLDGKRAFFTARLITGPNPLQDTVSVNFILSTTGREDDACWLIDSILIRPQSMRRRRRK